MANSAIDESTDPPAATIRLGRFELPLSTPLVMGIVNVTPDSFYAGSRHATAHAAIHHALELRTQGADIIDVGGESTRPGATPVALHEELRRVLPVVEALSTNDFPISVDTSKPEVIAQSVARGASMINDVNALQADGALEAAAAADVGVCLMHRQGDPQTMQNDPHYGDVVNEVLEFLHDRIEAAERTGIARERIVVDPGFGFGKRTAHNVALLRHLGRFRALGVPLLVGPSRKAIFGRPPGCSPVSGPAYSLAAALLAAQAGAAIIRTHDVAATRDVLAVLRAVNGVR
ncbi:MAG TPA: dihydropteroate synthase [Burkholderiales bacterium]|nr:dihydropteroate synthase [Burkholderiales bacterium]